MTDLENNAFSDKPNQSPVKPDEMTGAVLNDRYRIIELIGCGAWGSVYKASDLANGEELAIKTLHKHHIQDEQNLKRFSLEYEALRRVESPHVVKMIDLGLAPAPYIVMEYCRGTALDKWLKANTSISLPMAINLFRQLCQGLGAAEALRIVHRDLKPSNILIEMEGGLSAKILDFGIAKVIEASTEGDRLTATGDILGSPPYMSPEHWKGKCDNRSDIYSLGCIMYEVLAREPAFSAQFGIEYMSKHFQEQPKSFSHLYQDSLLSMGLQDIIDKCMQKSPANRYQSVAECIKDLNRLSEGFRPAVSLPEQTSKFRRKLTVSAFAIVSLFVMAICIQNWISSKQLPWTIGTVKPEPNTSSSGNILTEPIPIQIGLRKLASRWKDKTLTGWSEAIEQNPSDPKMYFERAMLHRLRNENPEAQNDLDNAISLDPNYGDAFIERSITKMLNSHTFDYQSALADANRGILLKPSLGRAYFARATVYQNTEQNELAIADCKKALALANTEAPYGPTFVNVFETYSTSCINLGRLDEAAGVIDLDLKSVHPKYKWFMYRQRAMIHGAKQEFEAAISDIDLALKESDWEASALIVKAYALAGLGKMAQAEDTYLQGQRLAVDPVTAYRRRAEYWRTAGNLENAIQDYSKVIALEQSRNYFSYRMRALCYLRNRQLHDALTDVKEAVALNPHSGKALGLLALIQDKLGQKEEAEKNIEKAFSFSTRFPLMYVYRASLDFSAGKIKEALTDCNQAIGIDPYLKEAFELRSEVLKKCGREEEAEEDRSKSQHLVSHLELFL